jgi:hypothetical protein
MVLREAQHNGPLIDTAHSLPQEELTTKAKKVFLALFTRLPRGVVFSETRIHLDYINSCSES